MLATAMVTMSVMILALYVITVIAYWQIFKKAGEKGWKSLIPLYNSYIMYKISWKTSMFWIMLILDIVYAVLACINVYAQNGILSFLSFAIYIAVFVIAIISMHKLSKAFGHGAGFTVGLVLLSPIFILILAFGSSQYVGNTTVTAEKIEE
ncbi:hypothetical protein FMM68_04920 [Lachnospiraceae bacterium MD329]|nr:hypothetical protein [Lachnospiraceae bacterium MD329]